jgi:predicted O-methyltransferase YrrM
VLNDRQEFFERVTKEMAVYGDRFVLIRDFSDNVVDRFKDGEFDFIFIDGLHTYEQLTKDCHNYYSKVKDGGIFSGHDYETIPGVHQAVLEFAPTKTDKVLTTECDVWYWYK